MLLSGVLLLEFTITMCLKCSHMGELGERSALAGGGCPAFKSHRILWWGWSSLPSCCAYQTVVSFPSNCTRLHNCSASKCDHRGVCSSIAYPRSQAAPPNCGQIAIAPSWCIHPIYLSGLLRSRCLCNGAKNLSIRLPPQTRRENY